MAIPTLTYWSELWTLTKMQEASIETPEMQFLRSVIKYKRIGQKRNSRIREELNVFKLNDKILEYRTNWENHVLIMEESRRQDKKIPRSILFYKPRNKRRVGRPYLRWIDCSRGRNRS